MFRIGLGLDIVSYIINYFNRTSLDFSSHLLDFSGGVTKL